MSGSTVSSRASRRRRLAAAFAGVAVAAATVTATAPDAGAGVVVAGTRLVAGIAGAEPTGEIVEPQVTPDRTWLTFSSDATNLVPGDTNGVGDVFVKNLETGTLRRITGLDGTESDSDSYNPTICDDGSVIAFTTDTDLYDLDFDTNGSSDVYLYDRDTDGDDVYDEVGASSLYRISIDPSGLETDFGAYQAVISGDCNWVAFVTADPLAASDQNDSDDVYVRHTDPTEEYLRRISNGSSPEGGGGFLPSLSANGRHVVYASFASDIAAGGQGFKFGYYLRDRDADNDGIYDEGGAGRTDEYVNQSSAGVIATGGPDFTSPAAITPDGRCVAFRFFNGFQLTPESATVADAVFLRDRAASTTELISKNNDNLAALDTLRPAVSPDCRYVTFDAQDAFLLDENPSTGRDVYLRDRTNGTLDVLSTPGDGSPQFGSNQSTQVFDDAAALIVSSNAKVGGATGGSGARDAFLLELTEADTTAPLGLALNTGASRWTLQSLHPLSWYASDDSGPPTIAIQRRIASFDGKYTDWAAYRSTLGPGGWSAAMRDGQTQCFVARATDAAGNATSLSAKSCVARPMTSRSLTFSTGKYPWIKRATTAAYGGQYLYSATKGAAFSRSKIVATRVAVVVTRCKGCGTVDVYWNNKKIKSLNLNDTRTRYQQVLEVASFTRATSGTLKVVVTSSGKRVYVEGVGVYRQL